MKVDLADAIHAIDTSASGRAAGRAHPDDAGRRPRVLLAGGDGELRDELARLLAGRYEVQSVRDGEAALAALRDERPDLILSDVKMPRLDGMGLLRAVRADPGLADLPVLLLASDGGDASLEGLASGADDCLVQPFGPRELLARVSSNIEMARMRGQRRRAEESARMAEEKLQAALVASRAGTFRWHILEDRVEFDDAIAQLFGLVDAAREARVEDFVAVIHTDDRAGFQERVRRCIDEGADFHMEFRITLPDGSVRWILDQGRTFRDGEGRPSYLTGVCMDITERKRAEDALRASEARLRLAVEAGELGTWELDLRTGGSPTRTFRHDQIFGYEAPLADWSYEAFLAHVVEADRGHVDRTFRAALEAPSDWAFQCRIRRTDGAERWIEARGRPELAPDGRPVRLMGIVADITERKQAETEQARLLRQLEFERARLDALIQQMPLGVFIAEAPDGRVIGYNAKAEEILGHPVLPTNAPNDYVAYGGRHPDGTAYGPDEYPAVRGLQGEHIDQEDMVYLRGDGRVTTISVSASPVRDRSGQVVAAVCTFQDVGERRRVERALAESERRYRFLADSIPQIVWTADAVGGTDYFNRRWHEYTGLSREGSVATGWRDAIHPDDLAPTLAAWNQATRKGTPYRVEHRVRRADGAYRWMLSQAEPMRDEAGDVVKWFGTSTDIDDAKRAEAEYRQESEARRAADRRLFMGMIEGSSDAIAAWDPDFRLTAFNASYQRHVQDLFGVEVAVGMRPIDVFPLTEPERQHAREVWSRALKGEQFTLTRSTGETARERRHFEVTYYPLRGGDGSIVGAFHVARDITDRTRMEAALRASEEQLRQAQKMEAIGQLTGGVAHDFNNLLQVIRSNLQLLSPETAASEQARRRLSTAIGAVERGARLTQQLLAFARRQPLEPKAINVARVLKGMDDLLRRTIGETVELETVIAGGLWNTFADAAQVESAILNLAVNARDAMGGHGKLTIEANNALLDDLYARQHGDVQPGQYVMIAVTDTGCGMTPEVMARAFEPFFTTKPEGKGTGLGLSMVYGFAKQSNGHVKIYSEVGHGTTVKLYLPRSVEAEQVVAEMHAGAVVGGSETILVVEDDAEVRETVVDLLGDLGYRVLRASEAQGALAILQSGIPVDLLFTDVVMPGQVRSPELARQAKQLQPGIAVLFTSGYTENAIVHGGRLDPGVDLLSKPYSREQLARKVRHMLANRQQRALAQAPAQAGAAARAAPPARPLHVLLVEDDPEIRAATADMLDALGHKVKPAVSGEDALRELDASAFDVLFTDLGLPGMTGSSLVREALRRRPGILVVFASGYSDGYAGEDVQGAEVAVLPKPYGLGDLARTMESLAAKAPPRKPDDA